MWPTHTQSQLVGLGCSCNLQAGHHLQSVQLQHCNYLAVCVAGLGDATTGFALCCLHCMSRASACLLYAVLGFLGMETQLGSALASAMAYGSLV